MIFLSRFMLDLRGLYFSENVNAEGNATETTTRSRILTDIRFTTSNVVGNLGAPLSTMLSYSDFSATSSVASSHPGGEGGADEKQTQSQAWPEWDEDEAPKYANHPFEEGMMIPVWVDVPRTAEVGLEEVQSPVSPVSLLTRLRLPVGTHDVVRSLHRTGLSAESLDGLIMPSATRWLFASPCDVTTVIVRSRC